MTDTPGFFSKLLAIIGIVAFALSALFSILLLETLFTDPPNFEEGLGKIFTIIITLVYALGLASLGSIFTLLGQIWRQTKLIVYSSTLFLSVFVFVLLYVTINAISSSPPSDPGIFIIWAVIALVYAAHIKGIMNTRSD